MLEHMAKDMHHTITQKEANAISNKAGSLAGKDQTLDKAEFFKWANWFGHYAEMPGC